MISFKRAQGNTAASTAPQESVTKLLHLNSSSSRDLQFHSSNIVLIKRCLIFYLLFLVAGRRLSGKCRAETSMGSWATELHVLLTAIICGLSAQQLTGISLPIWACSAQTNQPPFQMQLVCFRGHFICHGRSRQTPEPTAEHLPCSLTGISTFDIQFRHWFYLWDSLLKGLPASYSSTWLAAKPSLFLGFLSDCCFGFFFFSFLTPVTQTEHQRNTAGARPVAVTNTPARARALTAAQKPGHPALLGCTVAGGNATPCWDGWSQRRQEATRHLALPRQDQAVW